MFQLTMKFNTNRSLLAIKSQICARMKRLRFQYLHNKKCLLCPHLSLNLNLLGRRLTFFQSACSTDLLQYEITHGRSLPCVILLFLSRLPVTQALPTGVSDIDHILGRYLNHTYTGQKKMTFELLAVVHQFGSNVNREDAPNGSCWAS